MTGDPLRILCVLPTLNPYGGVVSVVNAMNVFVDRGHHVTLASMSKITQDKVHPRTEPVFVEKEQPLPEHLATSHDVLIATSWETAPLIAGLARHSESAATFYYIQDYEADFYPEDDAVTRRKVIDTYSLIEHKVVKTTHLQDRLAAEGFAAERIPIGMDLDVFYPRSGPPSTREPGVIAMARPEVHHRGYDILVDVYDELARRRPGLRLGAFGPFEPPDDLPGHNYGLVDPSQLPGLYSSYRVFVDVSRIHGFGRTGVEAMACGTACVLSDSGGISEYAVHEENALIVPVEDSAATVDAIERLLDDPGLADRLAAGGVESVAGYSDYAAADAFEAVFKGVLAAR